MGSLRSNDVPSLATSCKNRESAFSANIFNCLKTFSSLSPDIDFDRAPREVRFQHVKKRAQSFHTATPACRRFKPETAVFYHIFFALFTTFSSAPGNFVCILGFRYQQRCSAFKDLRYHRSRDFSNNSMHFYIILLLAWNFNVKMAWNATTYRTQVTMTTNIREMSIKIVDLIVFVWTTYIHVGLHVTCLLATHTRVRNEWFW